MAKFLYAMVGMKYRGTEQLVREMYANESVTLKRDHKNPHDINAIAVWARKTHIAFVPKAQAADLAKRMDAAGVETLYGLFVPSHRAVEVDDAQLNKGAKNDDQGSAAGPAAGEPDLSDIPEAGEEWFKKAKLRGGGEGGSQEGGARKAES